MNPVTVSHTSLFLSHLNCSSAKVHFINVSVSSFCLISIHMLSGYGSTVIINVLVKKGVLF